MSFTNSCAIIEYPCPNGKTYINPCDCSTYLQCDNGYSILRRLCPGGTLWDHVDEACRGENQVIIDNKRCELKIPWRRCKDVGPPDPQNPSTLRKICSHYQGNEGANENDDDDGGGGSAAAVVGGIVGGLLILIIIAIIVFVMVKKKKPLPKWFRSRRATYKSNTQDQQNEPVEDVYDVIDEKQVSTSKPVDNPGYGKQTKSPGVSYHNTAVSNSHNSSQGGASNADELSYSTLKPDAYNDITRSYSTLRATEEDNLSRSISINGEEVPVQDNQGYFIGYPSGTVPRQPSPIPPNNGKDEVHEDDGYSLGKAPEPDVEPQPILRLPSDYFVLQSPA